MPAVYDPEKLEKKEQDTSNLPPSDEGLRHITGITPDEEKVMDKSAKAPEDLSKAEQSAEPHENPVGQGYTGAGVEDKKFKFSGLVRTRRRKAFVFGGIATAIVATMIAAFTALLPLKILHIGENLEKRFFATSEQAVGNEVETYFSNWITQKVLPGMQGTCTSTKIDRSCVKVSPGNGPFSKLYNGWRDSRLENKLYKNYGIEFAKVGDNKYLLRAPGLPDADITKFVNHNGDMFAQLNRSDFRRLIKQSLNDQTKWGRVLYYFKVGPLVERKYGVRRCVAAKPCGLLDTVVDKTVDKKTLYKAWFTQHILGPRRDMEALAVECVLNGGCEEILKNDASGPNGEKESKFETELQAKLSAYALEHFGTDKMDDLLKLSKDIQDKGYSRYLVGEVYKAIFKKELGQSIDKFIPIVGWGNFASTLVYNTDTLSKSLKKMNYVINSSSMIALFTLYRTYGDEIKAGDISAGVTGGFTDSLSPGAQKGDMGAEAEAAPLYGSIIDNNPPPATSSLLNVLSPRTYAASPNTNTYLCDNGKPVPTGKLTCTEENLGSDSEASSVLAHISDVIPGPVKAFAKFWHDVVQTVLGKILSYIAQGILYLFPGLQAIVNHALSLFNGMIERFITFIVSKLINSPISENMSGARTFDMVAGGADASGNDYAHNALGGVQLAPAQQAAILNNQQQQDLYQYQKQSFLARLFDKQSQYSPATKLAMTMPTSIGSAQSSFGSFLSNPFAFLSNALGSIFSISKPAYAAVTLAEDPFGITQYGYPADDPALAEANKNPEQYWMTNCTTDGSTIDPEKPVNKTYRDNATQHLNPDTYMPENYAKDKMHPSAYGTDPCYLLQAALGSAGALFDASLLTADDTSSGTSSTAASAPAPTETPTPPGIPPGDSSTPCYAGTRDIGIYTGYQNGSPVQIRLCSVPNLPCSNQECNNGYGIKGADGHALVNSTISKNYFELAAAAKAAGVQLSANSTFRTMEHQQSLCPCDGVHVAVPGYSNHQMGFAIDFAGLPSSPGPIPGNQVWDWLSKNANGFGIYNYKQEAWHWSPNGH